LPRFIVIHTLNFAEADFRIAAKDMPAMFPAGVSWNKTYCDFADKKFICEWEAPDRKTLEEVFGMIQMPFDTIYPVKIFNVATIEFEA